MFAPYSAPATYGKLWLAAPLAITYLLSADGDACLLSSNSTAPLCPFKHAQCNAVLPSLFFASTSCHTSHSNHDASGTWIQHTFQGLCCIHLQHRSTALNPSDVCCTRTPLPRVPTAPASINRLTTSSCPLAQAMCRAVQQGGACNSG